MDSEDQVSYETTPAIGSEDMNMNGQLTENSENGEFGEGIPTPSTERDQSRSTKYRRMFPGCS